jgi:hypothetical protein
VFRTQLGLGALGIGAAGTAVVAAAGSVHRASRGANHVVIAGQELTYPAINAAAAILLALAGLGVVVLAMLARGSWRQVRDYRSFVHGIAIAGALPRHPGAIVIDDPSPQAFCAGYLRPRVYVSRGALELLSEPELEAVLLHEDQHRVTRDPLRFACARLLAQALFFLPALRRLGDRYADLAEERADQAAVRGSAGEPAPLAAALLAFDAAAPAGVAGISPARVDSLLGQAPRRRFPSPVVALTLATLCSAVVLVWRASATASAHATLDLPVVSSKPCMLVLALIPALVCLAAYAARASTASASE